ncbi:MAG: dUTP diphosphatase [Pseudomonadales bacterium]|jgi:dimeric dUTPase (all-alpha-NTP-PPase superfamily)|nr:dUTP diphosphatase [Pseudomonadales bacterium]MDP6471881.1 dUTP diphosphatase [Pseudomonadales bacterium]MDP6826849.1 dUTP diphosphatase [Pseudomonadales bacterium]MDP6970873.1 dUTP diphosphatase [Pseudomonadales bacterium]|tara:strand:+ start:1542 stop:2174 length:633 start_codon:yes stop_codon:yes gene_type:complete
MDKAAMLDTMATMQDAFNTLIHPQWRTQGYEYYRAIWVECAEMLDHFGWKWWKHQPGDLDQVRLELVDIWHFGLSDMIRAETLTPQAADALDVTPDAEADGSRLRLAIEVLAEATLKTRAFELESFAAVMRVLPMSFDELFRLYVGKNVLNDFRQNHGYKDGSYLKTWSGREDNEHLVELLALIDRPATAVQDLYALLENRYGAALNRDS